ncbi:hypothetical protein QYF36_024429 [Acer negundo]|nr:hypothetical protein QYF36_024429 [Acer negundo]
MATETGLGVVPFFFVELDPQWAGICNGMAVRLQASWNSLELQVENRNLGNDLATFVSEFRNSLKKSLDFLEFFLGLSQDPCEFFERIRNSLEELAQLSRTFLPLLL